MSLNFKYISLTFLNDVNIIKDQIKNTVILRYLFDEYGSYSKLENLITGTQYGYNASALQSGKNKFLRISDITDGKVNWDTVPFCDCSDENTYLLERNDLLIARTGGTTGKSFIIDNPPDKAIFAGYLIRIRANQENNPEYLNLFLNSYVYWSQVVSLNKGEFRPSVNATKLKDLIVPKIDIGIQRDAVNISKGISVDGYEALENNITKALNDFDKSQEIIEHFNYQGNNVELLKQSILQEAIQGKLTADWREQNPNTETASELLKRIKAEKAQLIKDKKIKKEKALPPITAEEIPFELPEGWVWCRFVDIAEIARGGSPRPIGNYLTKDENGINWIKIGDTKNDDKFINSTREKIKPEGMKKSRFVEPGDFLLTNSMSFGRPYIMRTTGCIHDGWLLIRYTKTFIEQDYLYSMLSSKYVYDSFKETARGGVVQNLNIDKARATIIPIPPLSEQQAIIEKVESLMEKCQTLEKEIITSEANAQILMKAVLKEAFEGKQEVVEV